ncbi:MAG: hypothetical protein ABIH71_05020 [Candidatus Omnitrophota bacterium]|nr:hypothetical protein [Candidatus Omnitrophota bacterium]
MNVEDQRPKTEARKQKAESGKLIGRRRFLGMCGKLALGAIAVCVMPFEIGFSKDKKTGKTRFVMKIKPFRDSDLYKKHNLAG